MVGKNISGLVRGVDKAPDIKEEDINIMFQTNVTGLINMTQAILPIFKKRPDGGAGDIINIGSIAGASLPFPLPSFRPLAAYARNT
jgi:3-hydroxy acid dehydrogenase/malonic semialdehyde reductase